MLRGEGKRTVIKRQLVLSKKATLHVHQSLFWTFLCRCFSRLQSETSSYTFYGGNVVSVHVHFFFTAAHFSSWWPLTFLIFSPPLQAFHVVLPTKNVSFSRSKELLFYLLP